jgi:hypothetical protein
MFGGRLTLSVRQWSLCLDGGLQSNGIIPFFGPTLLDILCLLVKGTVRLDCHLIDFRQVLIGARSYISHLVLDSIASVLNIIVDLFRLIESALQRQSLLLLDDKPVLGCLQALLGDLSRLSRSLNLNPEVFALVGKILLFQDKLIFGYTQVLLSDLSRLPLPFNLHSKLFAIGCCLH